MCNRKVFKKRWSNHRTDKFRPQGGPARRMAWEESFKFGFNTPPANVLELDDQFELHLFAPEYEKSDFLIALIDQTLSISVKDKEDEEQRNWKRQEYRPNGFVRQFDLNERIDKAAIEAKYDKGVLRINLPKLEGFETKRQEIEVV